MVTPAAGFADFTWGSTKDDPLQALTSRPFVVRDAVPLGSAGTTRWLDEVESRLQGGIGGAALRSALTSAGVRYVLVRNDLRPDTVDSAGAQNLRVHEALAETGITAAASFGPPVTSPTGMEPETPDHTIDQRTRLPYPSIEIFDVGRAADAALVPGEGLVTVHGGAEDVADALASVDGAAAAVVGSDIGALPAGVRDRAADVLMDGNQSREVFFGRASNNTSQVLGPGDPRRTGRTVTDFVADPTAPQTERAWGGALRGVSASSSAADANASIRIGSGHGPTAAVDGDAGTAWLSGRYASAAGEWLQLDFARPTDVSSLSVRLEQSPRRLATPTEIRVDTDAGSATTQLVPLDARQDVRTAPGLTTRARITISEVAEGADANGVGLAEVSVPGIDGSTRLDVPPTDVEPSVVILRRTSDGTICVRLGRYPADVHLRRVATAGGGRWDPPDPSPVDTPERRGEGHRGRRPGDAVEHLLEGLTSADVTASSRAVPDPAGRPGAAMDGDLGTGWVASPTDPQPRLTITLARGGFGGPRAAPEGLLPRGVSCRGGRGVLRRRYARAHRRRLRGLPALGPEEVPEPEYCSSWTRLPFAPRTPPAGSGRCFRWASPSSVVPGFNPVGPLRPSSTSGAACGFGPDVVVDGTAHSTAVSGTVAQLLRGEPLSWTSCDGDSMSLGAGTTTIDAPQSAEFSPVSLVVDSRAAARVGSTSTSTLQTSTPVVVGRPDAAHLTLEVPSAKDDSVLVVHQNYSAGWVATDQGGEVLSPIRVNGWQQGWVVPAGLCPGRPRDLRSGRPLPRGSGRRLAARSAGPCCRLPVASTSRCPAIAGAGARGLAVERCTGGVPHDRCGPRGAGRGRVGVLASTALSRRATTLLVIGTGMSRRFSW